MCLLTYYTCLLTGDEIKSITALRVLGIFLLEEGRAQELRYTMLYDGSFGEYNHVQMHPDTMVFWSVGWHKYFMGKLTHAHQAPS